MSRHLNPPGSMPRNNIYLIIAESGRALAVSAVKAGCQCHVIDRFNDEDTAAVSLSQSRVNTGNHGLDTRYLSQLPESFIQTPLAGIVTGGGLELNPDWLEELSEDWPLLANTGRTLRDCKSPERFFTMLDEAGIAHPSISLRPVHSRENWLLKCVAASGGGHIIPYKSGDPVMPQHYLQQRIKGRSFSIVFLADGRQANLAGISETWCRDVSSNDYRYRGAVSLGGVGRDLLTPFAGLASLITEKYRLRGLCGLDVIVDPAGEIHVLEVNPRPTATFPLHENSGSLFDAHIRAFRGETVRLPKPETFSAHEVIYNNRSGTMPRITWPDWVTDRPLPGEQLVAGQPLCTVHAKAGSLVAVKKLLAERVKRFMDHAVSKELEAA